MVRGVRMGGLWCSTTLVVGGGVDCCLLAEDFPYIRRIRILSPDGDLQIGPFLLFP